MIFIILSGLLCACQSQQTVETATDKPLFTLMPAEQTKVFFTNTLPEDPYRNILRYQYYYNGGGVALGDIDRDGLLDILFTANAGQPRLYRNLGGWQFEDITFQSGLKLPGKTNWVTGAAMVDINSDGLLDIYLCRSGNLQPENRRNLLYINRGDRTFTEQAARYGLDDPGYSIQAAFFDYDKDGDLDAYIANHAINFYGRIQDKASEEMTRFSSDRLYQNQGPAGQAGQMRYKDISQKAGLRRSGYSYGLGVGIGDLNQDGYDDIYVSNDFYVPDFLYWNQGDGTFREAIRTATRQTSYFSMGNDLADINNDTLLDIVVLDMTAEDHTRRHANLAGLSYEKFREFIDKGYHFQYMYNSLNVNNGNGTFRNLAQLAGIARSDWSWAPLVADFDNDGHKDLYITNGLRKDVLNLDFINITTARFAKQAGPGGQLSDQQFRDLLAAMPSQPVSNFAFRNSGDLRFEKVTRNWGLDQPSFSNGAAYGDLDNDGDLDLVVNNIDADAFLFRNNGEQSGENYLTVKLKGPKPNTFALGGKVRVYTAEGLQYRQQYLSRGYQSSVDPRLHFGLGHADKADVEIIWPDGRRSRLEDVSANQILEVDYREVEKTIPSPPPPPQQFFEDITNELNLVHRHRENNFNDFKREFLLPHRLSALGPDLAVSDVNSDGLEDFFIGGAKGSTGALYRQVPEGGFRRLSGPWEKHGEYEDAGLLFFDADGDGAPDLYAASGGNEYEPGDEQLRDRLYLNRGDGRFEYAASALPGLRRSSSCVRAADIDGDGDQDLFVGRRQTPGRYPLPASSTLLLNDGKGRFADAANQWLPALKHIGMVSTALFTDFNGDDRPDLLITGEWMSPRFFQNEGDRFREITEQAELGDQTGWYSSLAEGDFDQDGDLDYLAGNLGLNYRFKASPEAPFEIFADDFDDNGQLDIVLGYHYEGKLYPVYDRSTMEEQMPMIKRKFPDYSSYASATLNDIFGSEALEDALHYRAVNFASLYLENLGAGRFASRSLPIPAQIAPINDFIVDDYDGDGHLDVLLAGNLYGVEYRTARADAGHGLFLRGDGKGGFQPVSLADSGFYIPGDVKALAPIRIGKRRAVLAGKNDDLLQVVGETVREIQ